MSRIKMIAVDLQNDFTAPAGLQYINGRSVDFVKEKLFVLLRDKDVKICEIISDYRQPRPGDDRDCCRPGEWGYSSIVPDDIRQGKPWIKSMNSPIWTRDGAGDQDADPGLPYQDTAGFNKWLDLNIGPRDDVDLIVIFGLTADCCVLAAVQEMRWRGYEVAVLSEGTDVRSGDISERSRFLRSPPFIFWGGVIYWNELVGMI